MNLNIVGHLLKKSLIPPPKSLLRVALVLAVLGVVFGIIQLMLVLSVMTGFQTLLETNYTKITSPLVLIKNSGSLTQGQVENAAHESDLFDAVTPFVITQGLMIHKGVSGVVIEGIDLDTVMNVTPFEVLWKEEPDWEEQSRIRHWIWLGKPLADKLKVTVGQEIKVMLVSGKSRKVLPFVVTGITQFGIYDHDLRYVRVSQHYLRSLANIPMESMYKTIPKGAYFNEGEIELKINHVLNQMYSKNDFETYLVARSWADLNQNIFLAVQHQKRSLSVILFLIVALAAANIINLLVMNSQNKRKQVAMLRAMGLSKTKIFFWFVLLGGMIGLLGIGLGIVMGLAFILAVEAWQPQLLSESVYNTSYLPFEISANELSVVALVGLGLCMLFSVLPAIHTARQPPVKVLRTDH